MTTYGRTTFVCWLVLFAGLGCAFLYACSTANDSARPAQSAVALGFSDPQVLGGHVLGSLYGCHSSEVAHDVEATNSSGRRVRLLVCCGVWLKGCTVRTP